MLASDGLEALLEFSCNSYVRKNIKVTRTSTARLHNSLKPLEVPKALPLQGTPIMAVLTSGLHSMSSKAVCYSSCMALDTLFFLRAWKLCWVAREEKSRWS